MKNEHDGRVREVVVLSTIATAKLLLALLMLLSRDSGCDTKVKRYLNGEIAVCQSDGKTRVIFDGGQERLEGTESDVFVSTNGMGTYYVGSVDSEGNNKLMGVISD